MTSFSWKRKQSEKVAKVGVVKGFKEEEQGGGSEEEETDWLTAAKKKKLEALEDSDTRFLRLREEGVRFAEREEWWHAVGRWKEALGIRPTDEKVWEMKAQALASLREWTEAETAARRVVSLAPRWAAGHQSLARVVLGQGKIGEAVRSLQLAIHLEPWDPEIAGEDLPWALSLRQQEKDLQNAQLVDRESDSEDTEGNNTESEGGESDS